ncbi:MAG: peptide deformylase [Nitrospirae bacterium]|nr:peptide deformylase [Nitrospirota bacterium]
MSILEIKKFPNAVLKQKTSPVTNFDSELQKLIDDMIETMYANHGVGLAANQVGVSKRVIVIDVSKSEEEHTKKKQAPPLIVLINPEIIHAEGEYESEEGCLSLPGYRTIVKRAERVKVIGLDREEKPVEIEGTGLLSRALQHEIDHIDGLLLIDRIGRVKKELFKKRYKKSTLAVTDNK